MDLLLAWTDWQERLATTPYALALGVLVVGGCCLYLELVGRVLGTYVRTLPRIAVRSLFVLLAPAALAIPFLLALSRSDGWATFWLLLSSLLSLLIAVNFVLPYRFGIRRMDAPLAMEEKPLAPGIILRRTSAQMALPPEGPGALRCLVLSDLHCTWRFSVNKLRAALAALPDGRYDMVFVLGDLGESPALLPEVMRAIADLRPTHGVFCVRGNHDFERGRAELIARLAREHSITLLANSAHTACGVEIVGLEHPWDCGTLPPPAQSPFAVGLSHTPDNIKLFSRLNVPLAVAGHTHAGKFRLPVIGSFPLGSKYGRFLDEGWFQFADTRLYITPGIRHLPGLLGRPGVIVELTITDPARRPPKA